MGWEKIYFEVYVNAVVFFTSSSTGLTSALENRIGMLPLFPFNLRRHLSSEDPGLVFPVPSKGPFLSPRSNSCHQELSGTWGA